MKKFIMICLCSLVCIVGVMGCRKSQSQTPDNGKAAKENQTTTSKVVVPLEDPKQIELLNETELAISEQSTTTRNDNSEPVEMDEKAATPAAPTDPATFVRVKDYIDHIHVELKYNTTDNFTGQQIYDFSEAYLRYGTVQKLIKVQEALMEHGLSLKIWDAFRPIEAQFVLWEVCPNPTYVANPNKGVSSHSRGNSVDITLTDQNGHEVEMPTPFDDFSSLADRDYSDCTEEAKKNAKLLEQIMTQCGFQAYYGE